jgi:hypothetical protein
LILSLREVLLAIEVEKLLNICDRIQNKNVKDTQKKALLAKNSGKDCTKQDQEGSGNLKTETLLH